jgi:hypothetical protein
MADDKKKGSLDEASIEREREWNARVDWFLQSLVDMVNSSTSNVSFNVTLSVGGVLVSGELIGGQHYFDGFGAEFTKSFDENAAKTAKESFSKLGEIYRQGGSDETASGKAGTSAGPSYIHLKNARFSRTDGKPASSAKGVWWRGKLSAVDGFTLGVQE